MLKVSNFNPIIVRLKLGSTIPKPLCSCRFQSYNSSIKTDSSNRILQGPLGFQSYNSSIKTWFGIDISNCIIQISSHKFLINLRKVYAHFPL